MIAVPPIMFGRRGSYLVIVHYDPRGYLVQCRVRTPSEAHAFAAVRVVQTGRGFLACPPSTRTPG